MLPQGEKCIISVFLIFTKNVRKKNLETILELEKKGKNYENWDLIEILLYEEKRRNVN
jgi:hypothetical protein